MVASIDALPTLHPALPEATWIAGQTSENMRTYTKKSDSYATGFEFGPKPPRKPGRSPAVNNETNSYPSAGRPDQGFGHALANYAIFIAVSFKFDRVLSFADGLQQLLKVFVARMKKGLFVPKSGPL
jgi:hypothetical protein